ncbi:MAG TPA: hypothetical protein VK129_06145 [Terriglobales bacterium]|nr:hypothetical protein [Terriglobales bacterium]
MAGAIAMKNFDLPITPRPLHLSLKSLIPKMDRRMAESLSEQDDELSLLGYQDRKA